MSCSKCDRSLNARSSQRYIQCGYCGTLNNLITTRSNLLSFSSSNNFSFDTMRRALPHPAGPKRAVICAVSYKSGPQSYLPGTINDARTMKRVLVDLLDFPPTSILMLNEEEKRRDLRPTVKNIVDALRWLVRGCQPGDSLVFHYCGHGAQSESDNDDEVDGKDEVIVALDGEIIDDQLNDLIVKPIPEGVKLHAVMDCCHSGTILDLPFLCKMGRNGRHRWIDHRPRISGEWKGTRGGEVFCFSGCDDDQTSMESHRLVRGRTVGVMTYWFIDAVAQLVYRPDKHALTYGDILDSIHFNIGEDEHKKAWKSLIKTIEKKHHRNSEYNIDYFVDLLEYITINNRPVDQMPQLTASKCFDVYKKRFTI